MRLLDLFCGAGGAAVGYHEAGFEEIVGVDNKPQPRYPFAFVQMDALEAMRVLLAGGYITDNHGRRWYLSDFDAIHASPPCQKHTMLQGVNKAQGRQNKHIDLIEPTRKLLVNSNVPYVIENVQGSPLLTSVIICGRRVGLENLSRHRHFETSFFVFNERCDCRKSGVIIGVYGDAPDGHRVGGHPKARAGISRLAKNLEEAQEVMGIDWMEWDELKEAIPPAYTKYIGRYLIAYLEGVKAEL